MSKRRQQLEETAHILRTRLDELRAQTVSDIDRPTQEVALDALRRRLTEVGHQLSRLAVA